MWLAESSLQGFPFKLNPQLLAQSHSLKADTIVLDLEDSVADHRKGAAREAVLHGLNASPSKGPELSVRINPPSGNQILAGDDLELLLPVERLESIVVPKVESADDVRFIYQRVRQARGGGKGSHGNAHVQPLSLVLSIESAQSLLNLPTMLTTLKNIADPPAVVSSLLFASEDFCHSAGITRTRSRRELLFPRQQMALIAKAFGLSAIDMVCIDYQDLDYLKEECKDGMEIGFDGKQAVRGRAWL